MKRLKGQRRRKPTWSLGVRRGLAVVIVGLLVAIALLVDMAGKADFARAAELVRTQEQKAGVLIDVKYRGRNETEYTINVNGHERELYYGHFIPDETPGSFVRYVVDPEVESRLIAVGDPEDWEENPLADAGLTLFVVTLALIGGGIIAARIVPEDFDSLWQRLFSGRHETPAP